MDSTRATTHSGACLQFDFGTLEIVTNRQPTPGFWATIVALAAWLYLLSFGPLVWLADRAVLPRWANQPVSLFYAPVFHLSLTGPRPIRQAIIWYGELGTRHYAEPLLEDPAIPAIENQD